MNENSRLPARSRLFEVFGSYAAVVGLTAGFVYALGAIVSVITFHHVHLPLGRSLLLTQTQELIQRGTSAIVLPVFAILLIMAGTGVAILLMGRISGITLTSVVQGGLRSFLQNGPLTRIVSLGLMPLAFLLSIETLQHRKGYIEIAAAGVVIALMFPSLIWATVTLARTTNPLRSLLIRLAILGASWTLIVALASAAGDPVRLDSVAITNHAHQKVASGYLIRNDASRWYLGQTNGTILTIDTPNGGTAEIHGPRSLPSLSFSGISPLKLACLTAILSLLFIGVLELACAPLRRTHRG